MQRNKPLRFFAHIFLISLLFFSSLSYAEKALTQRQDVQKFINNMVAKHGFKKQELIAVFNDAKLQPQIIESMNMPFEKKDWDTYKQLFLTPQRLQAGLDFWQATTRLSRQ